jgi:chromosome segregation protein
MGHLEGGGALRHCFLPRTKGLDAKVLSTKAIFLGGSGDRMAGADHNMMPRVPGAAGGAQLLVTPVLSSSGKIAYHASPLVTAMIRGAVCVLDEVDAPLDEANIGRFTKLLTEMATGTQFIVITHSKKTMLMADVLYGVTMETPGISKLVSVELRPSVQRPRPLGEDAPAVA